MSTVVVPEQHEAALETDIEGSWRVLLRGLRESPELRKGLGFTVVLSLLVTAANLVIPVLIQQIVDHGFQGGFRPAFVYGLCAAATGLVAIVYFASRHGGEEARRGVGERAAHPPDPGVRTHP